MRAASQEKYAEVVKLMDAGTSLSAALKQVKLAGNTYYAIKDGFTAKTKRAVKKANNIQENESWTPSLTGGSQVAKFSYQRPVTLILCDPEQVAGVLEGFNR